MKIEQVVFFNGKNIIEANICYDIKQMQIYLLSRPELKYYLKLSNKFIKNIDKVKYKDLICFLNFLINSLDDEIFYNHILSFLDISIQNIYPLDSNTLNFLEKKKIVNIKKLSEYQFNYNIFKELLKYKKEKGVKKYEKFF